MVEPDATIGRGREAIITCHASESFSEWMSRAGASIAITTYQAGKLVLVGWDGRRVTVLPRNFDRPMGLSVVGRRLALATRLDVCLFADSPGLAGGYRPDEPGRYDALYVPRTSYHTGELNSHDVGFGPEGLWIVATRFSCLALAMAVMRSSVHCPATRGAWGSSDPTRWSAWARSAIPGSSAAFRWRGGTRGSSVAWSWSICEPGRGRVRSSSTRGVTKSMMSRRCPACGGP
jgi:hypothetical protein